MKLILTFGSFPGHSIPSVLLPMPVGDWLMYDTRSTSGVDWKKRDAEIAVALQTAAICLKNIPGRPARVTRTAVGRAISAVAFSRQKLHKMPLTCQALSGVVETREGYAVRRVQWATDLYCQENVLPRE